MKWHRRPLNLTLGLVAAVLFVLWRLTCRYRSENDPRTRFTNHGRRYIYAMLHAHQLAATFISDDRPITAMVSRSADGDLLVPALRTRRVIPIRGSTRKRGEDKGGQAALDRQTDYLNRGIPALLAVDGPTGPRNHVHRGALDLALRTGAAILPAVVIPSRRWILPRTWDRTQIPKPFSRITVFYGNPVVPAPDATRDSLRAAVEAELNRLEELHDANEAAVCKVHVIDYATRRQKPVRPAS